jgi:hypothetical protein
LKRSQRITLPAGHSGLEAGPWKACFSNQLYAGQREQFLYQQINLRRRITALPLLYTGRFQRDYEVTQKWQITQIFRPLSCQVRAVHGNYRRGAFKLLNKIW